ncbi:MAG: prepilin peptidase [Bdellovibrionaceae bacterium]|nr:prepilin peptidase [Pseudobdellovibrionaceae bacterium]
MSSPAWLPYTLVFLLGLIFGSFANVVIYRLPKGRSVVRPRSYCPKCFHSISWAENIPILSWLLLRGRCRHCSSPIHWRYPIVEFLMGLGFVLCWHYGSHNFWFLAEYLLFTFALICCAFIDLEYMLLPDEFTLSGILLGLLFAWLNPAREVSDALLGVLLGGGFPWVLAWAYYVFTSREGMGGGDIKLLAWIGAVLGWKAVPFVIVVASLFGTLVGVVISRFSSEGLKTVIPFGPFLSLAALIYIFGGQTLADWYFSFFIPGL